jgi:DNA-directed RNA polymerase specialized sigma24 family protein
MPPTVPAPRPATLESLTEITREISSGQAEVNRLSEDRKRIIRDLDGQGVDYKAMAGAMGVTVATVYRIVPKARRA